MTNPPPVDLAALGAVADIIDHGREEPVLLPPHAAVVRAASIELAQARAEVASLKQALADQEADTTAYMHAANAEANETAARDALLLEAAEALEPFAITRENWPHKRIPTDADNLRAAALLAKLKAARGEQSDGVPEGAFR